jgi:outer membrane receptor protein involved in Fe transport
VFQELAMTAAFILAALAFAGPVDQDQSAPAPAQAPPAAVSGVTVTASKPDVQTSIDRRSYSVANDLQAQVGSIGDVLRNIPSVQVDVNGNLSLRGDSNVTVLIDGQPSSQFKGESLAQALQSLPANRIDRVEVITNPSAEFRAEGSGGVINLVTKKAKRAGPTGSVLATVRNDGGYQASLNGGYNSNKLSLNGDLSYRHLFQNQDLDYRRSGVDPVSGNAFRSREMEPQSGIFNYVGAHGGADYDLDARTRLSLEARGSYFHRNINGPDHFEMDVLGSPAAQFDRLLLVNFTSRAGQVVTTLRQRYGEGHDLTVSLGFDDQAIRIGRTDATTTALPLNTLAETVQQLHATDIQQTSLRADLNKPLANKAKLKLGYALDVYAVLAADTGADSVGGAPVSPDPLRSNRFVFNEALNQAYVTYEQPFGKLTVLAGLRAEVVGINLRAVASPLPGQDYARLFPTLHLAYALGDGRQLTGSYSRRINRPVAADFNPFQYPSSPQQEIRGNPDIRPEHTDSLELGFESRRGASSFLATLLLSPHHRRHHHLGHGARQRPHRGGTRQCWSAPGRWRRSGQERQARGQADL